MFSFAQVCPCRLQVVPHLTGGSMTLDLKPAVPQPEEAGRQAVCVCVWGVGGGGGGRW